LDICIAAVGLKSMRARIVVAQPSASQCAHAFSSRSRQGQNAYTHYRPVAVGKQMRTRILPLTPSARQCVKKIA